LDERGQPRRSKLIIMERDPDTSKEDTALKVTLRLLLKVYSLITNMLSCSCRIMQVFIPPELQSVG
jgi:hypothetical protein